MANRFPEDWFTEIWSASKILDHRLWPYQAEVMLAVRRGQRDDELVANVNRCN